MAISPPKDPNGKTYEDMVTAYLSTMGYFTESNLTLKQDNRDVLELDIVATPSNSDYQQRCIIEVKSGKKIGCNEVFKLAGWMKYLNLSKSCLTHKVEVKSHDYETMLAVAEDLGIELWHFNLSQGIEGNIFPPCQEDDDFLHHTFFFPAYYLKIAERKAMDDFLRFCKDRKNEPEVAILRDYNDAIIDSFFQKSPLARSKALYNAYARFGSVTVKLIEYLVSQTNEKQEKIIWGAWNTSEQLEVQYLMGLEHRARVAIIKNALDRVVEQETLSLKDSSPFWVGAFENINVGTRSFLEGIEWLKQFEKRYNVPYFMQVFIEVFGGFYFKNCEKDRELLSRISGLTTDEIDEVLEQGFKAFFYTDWLVESGEMTFLKFVPAYMRGAGCFIRENFQNIKFVTDIYPQKSKILRNWRKALFQILEPICSVEKISLDKQS